MSQLLIGKKTPQLKFEIFSKIKLVEELKKKKEILLLYNILDIGSDGYK